MHGSRAPKCPSDFVIEVVPEDPSKRQIVAEHLFGKWQEVGLQGTLEGRNMNIDYYFFSTMQSFYDCMQQTVGEVGAYIAHHFSSERLTQDARTVFGIEVNEFIQCPL